jgi:predicted metal-dependent hydrolase
VGAGVAYSQAVAFDWTTGALAEGVRCYRNQEFWLAHEHWESVWLRLQEPEKTFLQALIQVTAAFHHLQTGNTLGTVSLLRRALRRLEPYPTSFEGIDLARLRKDAGEWLLALENGTGSRPASSPRIFPTGESASQQVSGSAQG